LQRRCGWLGWQLHPTALRSWLAEAVPLGLGDVVRTLTWQLDTILLSLLQPAAVVGIYSVAYRPLGPLNWLPRAVLQALFPAFARMAADDRTSLDRAFAHSIRLLWIISLPLAVAICFCAEPLITLLAGREYQAAVVPMRLLIWITSLSFLSAQFRFLFAAVGKQRLFAWLVILVFTVEAAVELLLIPHWGYFGACAGSVSGELLFTAVGLFICRRLGIGRIEWGALLRAAVAAGGMAGMLWFARGLSLPWLLAATAGATGTYFALCIWLGALQGDELRRFGEALTGLLRPAAGRRRPAERAAGLGEDHFG
jgi:O-antigen/teichoic acid export membrane protein